MAVICHQWTVGVDAIYMYVYIVEPLYSKLPKMRTPLYRGHFKMSQTVLYNINSHEMKITSIIRTVYLVPVVTGIGIFHCNRICLANPNFVVIVYNTFSMVLPL